MEKRSPMAMETLRRLMADRSIRAYLAQRRNERRADRSPVGLALTVATAETVYSVPGAFAR